MRNYAGTPVLAHACSHTLQPLHAGTISKVVLVKIVVQHLCTEWMYYMCTCTQHTCTHTCTHMPTHGTHTHVHTHAHTRHAHTRTHTCTHTRAHTQHAHSTRTHAHTPVHAHAPLTWLTLLCGGLCIYMRTHITLTFITLSI